MDKNALKKSLLSLVRECVCVCVYGNASVCCSFFSFNLKMRMRTNEKKIFYKRECGTKASKTFQPGEMALAEWFWLCSHTLRLISQ